MSRFERRGSTLRFTGESGPVVISVCRAGLVRVALGGDGRLEAPSFVEPRDWPETPFEVVDEEPVRLTTEALRLEVATAPRRLSFADAGGSWLLREPADNGMVAEPGPDGGGRVRASFTFSGEQHFYGLGHGGGRLDRLGQTRPLWDSHLGHGPGSDIGLPLLVSSRGHGLFFDNTSDAVLAVGRSDNGVRIEYTSDNGPLTWYFLIARDLKALMSVVAELLGRPPLPPRWALGFLQSTRHFENTAELRQLARTLREKRIPCDALIYLSTYGDALGWNRGVGHLELQPRLWSDPAALLGEMRAQHFEGITHEYPVIHYEPPLFAEAASRGYLLDAGYERASPTGANYRQGEGSGGFSN